MNPVTVLLFIIVIVLLVLLLQRQRRPVLFGRDNWWPATWNYDWSGGPGYSRRHIMHERGPYRGPHGPPHATPGGDGKPRR